MSTATTLRHHSNTFAFLPRQRDQRFIKSLRAIKIRTSRRKIRQVIRQMIDHRSLSTI
ncbi:hypothetical protein HQ487_00300 [Candidatus Uhrbacteria bacterium]|nr:hypothetical protein [Candidatus Uhrbacteria bacterium]